MSLPMKTEKNDPILLKITASVHYFERVFASIAIVGLKNTHYAPKIAFRIDRYNVPRQMPGGGMGALGFDWYIILSKQLRETKFLPSS